MRFLQLTSPRLILLLTFLFLEFVVHEAKVPLPRTRHLAPIDQRQLTTCILSDCASCHCDSVTCTWHSCFYCIPLRLCVLHRQVSECKIIRKNVAFRIIFALYPRLSNVSNSFAVFCLTCLFRCLIKRQKKPHKCTFLCFSLEVSKINSIFAPRKDERI